ncbi:hypothetical protein GA0115239_104824 [Streptomyces sp. BpilaLS-43]|uniref:hypothetical protein n=1 Tax=Streptomyces sp. BpilaLS-43 TaxID=1839778 RepID=UPI00081B7516|nr:hypothetical protein [Streptomyces sp. BpilaLS-43]SCD64036.1 hypothetical protein GA0115239_104824 [Streptomyces sp. BpilaLS-43]
MGKSTVAVDVIALAEEQGWPVLPFRMDEVEAEDRTSEAVGRRLGLHACPATLIARVANGGPALLVVDQLDAASSYSGRMPDVFEAVDEMLDALSASPDVKVVLVARTVDVEKDPRLTSLVSQEGKVERFPLGPLDDEAVHTVLETGGTAPQQLGGETLRLLRTPLHLAVFSTLSKSARTTSYRSLQELYVRYTEESRTKVERLLPRGAWQDITGQLVEEMSRRETVTVPYAVFDHVPRADLAVLVSAGILLHADNDRIGFFHETYFDHLFARSFVASGNDLHDFLATTGQALFRRAQTRQVLEHLRDTDRPEFRRTTVRLLSSDLVRPHLRFVVIAVLEQLDATSEDWAALDPLAWGDGVTATKLRGLLALSAWFEAADTGRWETWLAVPRLVPLVLPQLEWCTRHHPARVTELLTPYRHAEGPWRQRLLHWMCGWPSAESEHLIRESVDRGDFDEEPGCPSGAGPDFWRLFEQLAQEAASPAIRLLGSFLIREREKSVVSGHGDPFSSGPLSRHHGSGPGTLVCETAAKVPRETLDHVLPFVIAVARASHARYADTDVWATRWCRPPSPHGPSLDEALYLAAHEALRTLARRDPSSVMAVMEPLAADSSQALRFLACQTYAVWNRPDEALTWLMSAPERLRIGWLDSPRWASRLLIAEATRQCGDEILDRLVRLLLGYYPEWERFPEGRGAFGRSQYELLEAVAVERRTPQVVRRLGELERKFAERPVVGPRPVEAHWVGPPIDTGAEEHMTDAHWLSALKKYDKRGIDWSGERPKGGAIELASLLGSLAERQPERCVQLGLAFDARIPSAAFSALIRGVAAKADIDSLLALCAHARRIAGEDVGRAVCGAILTAATEAVGRPLAVSLLSSCASDADPACESARIGADFGNHYYGGDLLTAGMNSTRGEAALATSALLTAPDPPVQALLPILTRLVQDPIMAVRVCAAEAVTMLLRHAPDDALDLTQILFTEAPVDVHSAATVNGLLIRSLLRDTARFAPELGRALVGPPEAARRAGAAWAVLAMKTCLTPSLPPETGGLLPAAREGAAEMAASDPAHGAPLLCTLFHDSEEAVRKAAAVGVRHVASTHPGIADDLITSFLASPALSENPEILARSLSDSSPRLPSRAIEACQALASISDEGAQKGRRGHALVQKYLITAVIRLYRQGDRRTRAQCLDIIDGLYRADAWELNRALSEGR